LGDALGSNVVNITLVFGLALLLGPIRVERRGFDRDFALALGVPLLTLWFAFDGVISRGEGGLLLLIFSLWLGWLIRAGVAQRDVAPEPPRVRPWSALGSGAAGLAALVLAGRLFVSGASGIAAAFGVDAYVIGAIVVAVGTSLPELFTVVLARLRGHDDIGVGTLLGSNLFNGLAIVGVAASIHPIHASPAEVAITLGMGLLALFLLIPGRAGVIGLDRGVLLLASYIVFIVAILAPAGGV
jgi:cation:H+ antiporter